MDGAPGVAGAGYVDGTYGDVVISGSVTVLTVKVAKMVAIAAGGVTY
jgi:hypothetical protein